MSKAVSCCCETLPCSRVHSGVIAVKIAVIVEDKTMAMQISLSQQHRQVLVECDVLDEGGVDVASLLEQGLVAPVRVQPAQLPRHSVVLPDHHGVNKAENSLLVHSRIPGQEAEHTLARSDASRIWIFQRERKEILKTLIREDWESSHEAVFEEPDLFKVFWLIAVDSTSVNDAGDSIVGLPGPESTVRPKASI